MSNAEKNSFSAAFDKIRRRAPTTTFPSWMRPCWHACPPSMNFCVEKTGRAHGSGPQGRDQPHSALTAKELLLPRSTAGLSDFSQLYHPIVAKAKCWWRWAGRVSGKILTARAWCGENAIHLEQGRGKIDSRYGPEHVLVDLNRYRLIALMESFSKPDIAAPKRLAGLSDPSCVRSCGILVRAMATCSRGAMRADVTCRHSALPGPIRKISGGQQTLAILGGRAVNIMNMNSAVHQQSDRRSKPKAPVAIVEAGGEVVRSETRFVRSRQSRKPAPCGSKKRAPCKLTAYFADPICCHCESKQAWVDDIRCPTCPESARHAKEKRALSMTLASGDYDASGSGPQIWRTARALLRGRTAQGRDGKMTADWVINATLRPPQERDEESHHRTAPVPPCPAGRRYWTCIASDAIYPAKDRQGPGF